MNSLSRNPARCALLGPFLRRLVELVFDGRPEAREQQLRVFAVQKTIEQRKTRERLVIPADPVEATKLARRYRSRDLGTLLVRCDARGLTFDVGEWRSAMASRKNGRSHAGQLGLRRSGT